MDTQWKIYCLVRNIWKPAHYGFEPSEREEK